MISSRIRTALLLLLIILAGWGCSSNQSGQNSGRAKATEPAPQLDPYSAPLYPAQNQAEAKDFKVQLVNGESFELSAQKGKVVLLNIWATWCAPCHEETPEFVDLYTQYRQQGLEILGVSIDKQGPSVVKPFMEKYEVNYPVVIDDGTIMDKYGPTMGIPTTYIIGKEGQLRFFAVGAVTTKELEPRIQKLLEE
ncbi:TlpA disulfide reductase family protein [Fodinibius sediminis]|uniref:Peroxiredoxin n=1 Tax=Fodinibius sediminis TaxID=1214077 RepID=A0A521ACC3_9BACT|nr:TlpA disulfide reductase family protein [Fodinibius sediminis]SMO32477.1 Peroxiredoxin [Fodinibius sediminis]